MARRAYVRRRQAACWLRWAGSTCAARGILHCALACARQRSLRSLGRGLRSWHAWRAERVAARALAARCDGRTLHRRLALALAAWAEAYGKERVARRVSGLAARLARLRLASRLAAWREGAAESAAARALMARCVRSMLRLALVLALQAGAAAHRAAWEARHAHSP